MLPEAASSNEAVQSERQTVDHEVSTDTADADEVSVETSAPPSDSHPLPFEAEHESSLHRSVDNCDSLPAVDTEVLPSSCSDFTSTSSSVAVIKNDPADVDANAEDKCGDADALCDDADRRFYVGDVASCTDAMSASEIAGLDVGTAAAAAACDGEFISPVNITSSEDSHQTVTSQLNLISILAESFVSSTQSAASVVSTQATIGSSLVAAEALSDLRTSARGIFLVLLCRLLQWRNY